MGKRIPVKLVWLLSVTLVALSAGIFAAVLGTNRESFKSTFDSCVRLTGEAEADCFNKVIRDAYRESGLEAATALMESTSIDPGLLGARFAARCHEVAHALGEEVDPEREPMLESRGPNLCRSGFFHGIHNQRFAEHPDGPSLLAVAPTICIGSEQLLRVGRGGVGNGCRHALGHELLLRGVDSTTAAKACMVPVAATHNPESAVDDCLRGLYMEVFLQIEAETGYADPGAVCMEASDLSLGAVLACLGESGPSLFRMGEMKGQEAAFAVCTSYAEREIAIAEACAGGLGRAALAFLENDRSLITQYCQAAGTLSEACLIDAAASAMESEQDYSWETVCESMEREIACREKMRDIKTLVEARL